VTKNLFVTGKPGSGKTTLVREAILACRERCGGFYTEEIKEGSKLVGFTLKTLDGKEGVLAKKGLASSVKLNKYGIDVGVLETLGAAALQTALVAKEVIVIDEIGSMELFSDKLSEALLNCLASSKRVLATIRHNAQPFTDEVKRMDNTRLLYVSRDNYMDVKSEVKEWLNNG
jgi:nucleoside-triphosphatase